MSPSPRGRRYVVVESDDFDADWERGISEGWINPMADPVTLTVIKEALAYSPWAPSVVPAWPDNMRAIDFPRSAVHPFGRLRITYEIVEDDGEVHLVSVRNIS